MIQEQKREQARELVSQIHRVPICEPTLEGIKNTEQWFILRMQIQSLDSSVFADQPLVAFTPGP